MKRVALLFPVLLLLGASDGERAPLPQLDSALKGQLISHLETHALPPDEYVVSKFAEHDVVILGEQHRIRHDPVLVQGVIPLAYRAGVTRLAFEFARREDQRLIDKLVNGRQWNEELAREIIFRGPVWGYREYVDVLKAAWTLNRSLPRRAAKFRVLGLGDSPDWSYVKTPEDLQNPEVGKKVWRGSGEHLWAKIVLDEVASGRKVLAYCGIHHGFTAYKQPIVADGKFVRFTTQRFGNHLFEAIGRRAFTIYLHAPWNGVAGYDAPVTYSVDGILDALMRELPPQLRYAGFDTSGTPFGVLPGATSVYSHGYERFRLGEFCDGYIIQGPLSETEGATPIADFVNEKNLTRAQLSVPNLRARSQSAEYFNRIIAADANMQRRWRHLQ